MATSPHPTKSFGEPLKYDPDFTGPLRGRSCTDVIFLLIFLVFIVFWVAIGVYAFKNGDPDSLLIPVDSLKQKCGHDSQVLDKPYLYFIDISKCIQPNVLITGCKTKQICVKECPTKNYVYSAAAHNYKDTICDYDFEPTAANIEDAIEEGNCSRWYISSSPVTHRCLPKIGADLNNSEINITANQLHDAIKNIKYLAQAEEMVAMIAEDVGNSGWKILIGLVGALIICFIYIFLMRWIAAPVVWFSIIGVIAVLSFGIYVSADKYKTLKDNPPETNINYIFSQRNMWLALLIVLATLLFLTLLILIFLRKRIIIAIALIKEGSKAVGACTSSLFFPICPWILQILVLAFALAVGLYLASVGQTVYRAEGIESDCGCYPEFKNGEICDQKLFQEHCFSFRRTFSACSNASCSLAYVQNPTHVRIFHAVNIIGGFWGVFFASAFGEMILAATFATWYWTYKKSNVPFFTVTHSILRTFRYHIGTLAFGSLIITICRLIRIAIEYVDHKLKKYDNAFVKAILCCCKCFFWCLENFMKFINRNAYIMCAIHGKNFCASAKDAFSLLMRNILRVFVLDKVTDLLFFLGKILITACVGTVAYTAITNIGDTADLHYVLVPVVIISIGAFFISSVFFGVYSMAVDTLFLCFLEDCERNDGSPEKPYYMSKELMKILGKKNKKDKKDK